MIRISRCLAIPFCALLLAGCVRDPRTPLPLQVEQPPPAGVVAPDANVLTLIQNYYRNEEAGRAFAALPKKRACEQLVIALQNPDRLVVHNATTLLRDNYGSTNACGPIKQLLARLLADPKEETFFTRIVCCQILGKYPEEASIPILIQSLDDPGERHFMTPAPDGTAEHSYRAVWAEALLALELIGGGHVSSFDGRSVFDSRRDEWIAEAKAWWKRKESSNNGFKRTP